jgi:hypothetical protein
LLRSAQLASLLTAATSEQIGFDTGISGAMRLFDASRQGADTEGDHQIITLPAGKYRMGANYFRSASLAVVVREISNQEKGATDSR